MDIYNSQIPLYFASRGEKQWAITIGQTTYYSVPEIEVTPSWHRHENKHKEQWKKEGWIKFAVKYLWYQLTKGYQNNPFEVEARNAESVKEENS